jgi:uncharacterized RDD family membrane protein YckC
MEGNADKYYVRARGKINGPFDAAALQKLVRRGMLSRMHEISSDRQSWTPAGEVEELFPIAMGARAVVADKEPTSYEHAEPPPARPTAAANYYYVQAGTTVGPVPLSVLTALAQNGTLQPNDTCWAEGGQVAVSAGQLPALAQAFSARRAPLAYQIPVYRAGSYGGFWIRVVAALIDAVIVGIPAFVICLIIGILAGVGQREGGGLILLLLVPAICLAGNWLYFALMESSDKQGTLGKMAVGLKVTDLDGARISFGRATGRYFSKIITDLVPLYIGYMMVGWTQRKQGLHDMIASTLVMKKSTGNR